MNRMTIALLILGAIAFTLLCMVVWGNDAGTATEIGLLK